MVLWKQGSISNGFRDILWWLWCYSWRDLDTTAKQRSRSFILVPIDFSHITSYRLSNFCSRTHHLATIHNVTVRQTDGQNASISATVSYGWLKTNIVVYLMNNIQHPISLWEGDVYWRLAVYLFSRRLMACADVQPTQTNSFGQICSMWRAQTWCCLRPQYVHSTNLTPTWRQQYGRYLTDG